MLKLTTRLATSDDLNALAALFDAYRQFYEQAPDLNLAQRFIAERLKQQDSVIFVALDDERMLGFCQLYPTFCSVAAARIAVLYDLFVDASARKTGAGRALMLAAQHYAANNGYARLDLSTAKTNLVAQALYESLGWARDDIFFTYSKEIVTVPNKQ
ncbi:MAG: N-acetyltransferase family protein [Methylophilaceae bacterium]